MKIGWVGLGEIGTRMVKRLRGADHDVTVYRRGAGLAEAEKAGAATSVDYATLAAQSDILILCVYSDAQIREILFEGGALASMRRGAILAIHSTGAPAQAREIGARAPARVEVLDATFSAGPEAVSAGKTTLMVGGDVAALARATPVFSAYSAQIHHVGALGAAQTFKLLNNLIFAANLMNVAEIVRLAEAQGLHVPTLARVLQSCSGASFAMSLLQREAPPQVMLDSARPYLEKDVSTAMAAAVASGFDVSAFAEVAAYFQPTGSITSKQ